MTPQPPPLLSPASSALLQRRRRRRRRRVLSGFFLQISNRVDTATVPCIEVNATYAFAGEMVELVSFVVVAKKGSLSNHQLGVQDIH
ncbi:hypothetical protein Y1Q_0019384 [Alligator mississippiensis]|uniref:Uncharacterized protein n=1 Tax=Alligator mississippiensis TaxID=8496 RepID=A0A151MR08_ALLMI|nr:hypothetical protein Y1Q_0019384 [Alligator mississippiensis]